MTNYFAQSLNVVDTIFTKNIGHYGSCVHLEGPHSVYIKNCSFIENEAKKSGGAIYVTKAAALDVSSSKFLNNKAGLDGGAMCISTSGNLIVDGSSSNQWIRINILRYNKASRYGGAIFVDDRGALTFSSRNSVQIDYNTALVGGGIYIFRVWSFCEIPLSRTSHTIIRHKMLQI